MNIEINTEELRETRNLFVATPMFGGMNHGLYLKSILDLQGLFHAHGLKIRFSFLFNESLITRARNYMVDEFLRSDCTHMLFIDADIEFTPMDVLFLLAYDKDVIGAPYPKKSINWKNILKAARNVPAAELEKFDPNTLNNLVGDYVFNPVPGTTKFDVNEPLDVLEIGTGFMMIKREVFDKYREEYPHLKYKPDHVGQAHFDGSRMIHAYFDTVIDPNTDRYLSEDYMFCQNWRIIGGQVFLCPWMKTTHVGTYGFSGNLPIIANLTGSLG